MKRKLGRLGAVVAVLAATAACGSTVQQGTTDGVTTGGWWRAFHALAAEGADATSQMSPVA